MKLPDDARLCPACQAVRFGAPAACPDCGGPVARVTGGTNKYHARPVRDPADGFFASRREFARWGQLKLLEAAGAVTGLRRQVRYALDVNGVRVCVYVADFAYEEAGLPVVEDAKGYAKTPLYLLKKRLMKAVHGIDIKET